jgi:hypothetical protein
MHQNALLSLPYVANICKQQAARISTEHRCGHPQLIYNFPEELFADAGVMAIEHADFDGIERLALVTGL